MAVPKAMQEKYNDIADIIISYADTHLNDEYKALCLHALEKLCRKRPSPLLHGRNATWAAGIVYAIGSNNFIFDKSQPIHTTGKELAAGFGVAASTASAKAADIRKMLKISHGNAEWCLPSLADDNMMLWMVELNGMLLDVRTLPLQYQMHAYEKGWIPYVPALRDAENNKPADEGDNGQEQGSSDKV